jgi:hypothetical protein
MFSIMKPLYLNMPSIIMSKATAKKVEKESRNFPLYLPMKRPAKKFTNVLASNKKTYKGSPHA